MYFDIKTLLSSPVSRAAYSDRTAWLMAEMSRLAYFKFEGEDAMESLAEDLMKLNNKSKFIKQVKIAFSSLVNTEEVAKVELSTYLDEAKFTIVDTFNNSGTQAFLAIRKVQNGRTGISWHRNGN